MTSQKGHDYVIIGAGSAGCVLANRLSADPAVSVLLLEAGGPPTDPLAGAIGWSEALWDGPMDWGFRSVPQPFLNDRRLALPRGKALGGTSAINWGIYIRGARGDYDRWAQLGNRGWSHDDVLPYFRRAEANGRLDDEFHGTEGPLSVEDFRFRHPLQEMYFEALEDLGAPRIPDFNGAVLEGCGNYQGTLRGGRRCSAADGYLTPVLDRPNLTVRTGAHVTGIAFAGVRAVGVDYALGREALRAEAGVEVILAAGAIGSPHILLLSGVGPADEIAAHGLTPVHDLPGVGRNLLDHVGRPAISFRLAEPEKWDMALPSRAAAEAAFAADGTGPLSSMRNCTGAFVRLRETDAESSAQIYFSIGNGERYRNGPAGLIALTGYVCRPESRGAVTLASASPFDRPLIDLNYFSAGEDLERHFELLEFNRAIAAHRAFDGVRGDWVNRFADRDEALCMIRAQATTIWHMASTCRMGTDMEAVVGPDLKAHGLEGLRVADASVMPTMVSGNTNAPVIMIAEKAADLILGRETAS